MRPIRADFDGILPPFHLRGPNRQIMMDYSPFSMMGLIKADFDGILPRLTLRPRSAGFDGISPFSLLVPILMAFSPFN